MGSKERIIDKKRIGEFFEHNRFKPTDLLF